MSTEINRYGVSKSTWSSLDKSDKNTYRTIATGNKWGISKNLQSGLSTASSMLGAMSGKDLDSTQKGMREGIRSAISSIPVWGPIISVASSVVDGIGDITGLNLSNINQESANRAGIGGAAKFNYVMNSIPGNSMLWGAFAKQTDEAHKSAEIDSLGSAYGGSVGDIYAAGDLSKQRMLFGRAKANDFIGKQNMRNKLLTDMSLESRLRKSSSYGMDLFNQNQDIYSGFNQGIRLSKKGMKFPELDTARHLLSKVRIPKHEDGGKIESDKNIIPDGALHREKSHITDNNPDLKGEITEKGIPVVDSNGNQCAEVERGEITFSKATTSNIEDLYAKYQNASDEERTKLEIELGKYLVTEILSNTVDNCGTIKETKI